MTKNKSLAISYDTREHLFWLLASICVAIVLFHAYAVVATTRNVAARHILEREVSARTLSQGTLEFALIDARNSLDISTARSIGFREVKSPAYASRTHTSALSINSIGR